MTVLVGEIIKNKLVVESGDDYLVVDCHRINENNVYLLIDLFKFAPRAQREGKIIRLLNVSKALEKTINRMGLSDAFTVENIA